MPRGWVIPEVPLKPPSYSALVKLYEESGGDMPQMFVPAYDDLYHAVYGVDAPKARPAATADVAVDMEVLNCDTCGAPLEAGQIGDCAECTSEKEG